MLAIASSTGVPMEVATAIERLGSHGVLLPDGHRVRPAYDIGGRVERDGDAGMRPMAKEL